MIDRELTQDDQVLVDLTYRFGANDFGVIEAYPGTGRGWRISMAHARAAVDRLVKQGYVQPASGPLHYVVTSDGFDRAYMLGANHAHLVTLDVADLKPGDRVVFPNGQPNAVVNTVINDHQVRFFGAGLMELRGPVQCWPIWRMERDVSVASDEAAA